MSRMPCPICGALYESSCPFDVPRDDAPWLADYEKMQRGEMSPPEHQLMVARWAMHNTEQVSDNARMLYEELVRGAWGTHGET